MEILIVSPYIPLPLYSGACVRIYNLIKRLSLDGHKIVLLAGCNNSCINLNKELVDLCKKIYTYKTPVLSRIYFIFLSIFSSKIYPATRLQSKEFPKILKKVLLENKIDVVWVNFSIIADMLPDNLNKLMPVILDQHESERAMYYGYFKNGNFLEKIFAIINIAKLSRFERHVFSKISAIACVSKEEAVITKKYVKKDTKIIIVPNGVDKSFFDDESSYLNKKNKIIFCANLAIRRNVEAAVWFASHIFPKLKEKIPDIKFDIIGSWPNKDVLKLNLISGVNVIGMVEDIRSYYKSGDIFVAPYHFGAGTKLKVLEAMASGVPVVSTYIGAQGIDVINNENIVIANNEKDFLNSIIELLENSYKAHKIALAGKDLIKEKYSWDKIVAQLESEISKLIINK